MTTNPLQTPPAGRVFTTRTDPFLARQRKRRDHERDLKNALKQAETAAEKTTVSSPSACGKKCRGTKPADLVAKNNQTFLPQGDDGKNTTPKGRKTSALCQNNKSFSVAKNILPQGVWQKIPNLVAKNTSRAFSTYKTTNTESAIKTNKHQNISDDSLWQKICGKVAKNVHNERVWIGGKKYPPPLRGGGDILATSTHPKVFCHTLFATQNTRQNETITMKKKTTSKAPAFTIIEDTREQTPLTFPEGIAVERDTLSTGDYSIRGYENCFAIERKSITDFAGTMMGGYQADTQKPPLRFNNELARLKHFDLAAVIVTATPEELITFHHNCGADAHGALWNFALSIFATHGIPVFMLTDEPTAAKFVADLARHYIAARTKKNRGNAERGGKKSKNGQNPPPEAPEGWDF